MWIPNGAAFIRYQRLFETWHLLEEIRYSINFQLFSPGEITGNYFTPVASIIAIPII